MFLSRILSVGYRVEPANSLAKISVLNLILNQVFFTTRTMATNNETLKGKYENIEFPLSLKLTSSPNKIVLDKTNFDSEFDKREWKETPVVELESAESDKTYTLLAIDPDVPLHFAGEAILHWLVININGSDLAAGDVSRGKTILDYRGPGPLILTGFHRYIFLIYQENEINQDLNVNVGRIKFKLEQWIKNQSKPLQGPIAGVQFKSKF